MTGKLEEEGYRVYQYPASHVYGIQKEGLTFFDRNLVEEKQVEMVVDHECKTIMLRYAQPFRKEIITLPYSGFMAFRSMMEMAMEDLWQGMTEDERDEARYEALRGRQQSACHLFGME